MSQQLKLKGWAFKNGQIIKDVENRYQYKYPTDPNNPKGEFITKRVAKYLIQKLKWGGFDKMKNDESLDDICAVSFDKSVLQLILSQKDCQGIRCYFAKSPYENRETLVLVGYKEDGTELITKGDYLINFADKSSLNIKDSDKIDQVDGVNTLSEEEETLIAEVGGHLTFRQAIEFFKNQENDNENETPKRKSDALKGVNRFNYFLGKFMNDIRSN